MKRIVAAVSGAAVMGLALTTFAAKAPESEFVGSTTCKKCHAEEFRSWQNSYHSKMVRPQAEGILKGVVEKWATDGKNKGPTKGNVTGTEFKLDDVAVVVKKVVAFIKPLFLSPTLSGHGLILAD